MQNLRIEVTDWSYIIRCFICPEYSQIGQWLVFHVLVFLEGLDHFPMFSTQLGEEKNSTAQINVSTFLLKAEVESGFCFRGFVEHSIMAKD